MKACLLRHLVSINLLSRAAAEPSAGTDFKGEHFPHLWVSVNDPSNNLALRRGRRRMAHLPLRPTDFFQTSESAKSVEKGGLMELDVCHQGK